MNYNCQDCREKIRTSKYTDCPPQKKKKKKRKKKEDNQTFSINNFRNCELTQICFRIIKNITNYLHFGENPIRFGSVVTKKFGFLLGKSKKSTSLFHSSFVHVYTSA